MVSPLCYEDHVPLPPLSARVSLSEAHSLCLPFCYDAAGRMESVQEVSMKAKEPVLGCVAQSQGYPTKALDGLHGQQKLVRGQAAA